MKFSRKQLWGFIQSNERLRIKKEKNNVSIISGQSSCLFNQCFLPNYHDQFLFLCLVSLCDLFALAPLNTFGNHNIKTHLKIKKANEKKLVFSTNSSCRSTIISAFFSSVFYLVAPAPLPSFRNHNSRARKWKELRLTFIQDKKSHLYLKAGRTSRPDVKALVTLRVGWRVTLSWTVPTPRNFFQESGVWTNEKKTHDRLASSIFPSAARGMIFPVASVTLSYVGISLK